MTRPNPLSTRRPQSGPEWRWAYAVRTAIVVLVVAVSAAFLFGFIVGSGYKESRQLIRQQGW